MLTLVCCLDSRDLLPYNQRIYHESTISEPANLRSWNWRLGNRQDAVLEPESVLPGVTKHGVLVPETSRCSLVFIDAESDADRCGPLTLIDVSLVENIQVLSQLAFASRRK